MWKLHVLVIVAIDKREALNAILFRGSTCRETFTNSFIKEARAGAHVAKQQKKFQLAMSEEIRDCVFMVSRNLRAEEGHDLAYLYDLPAKYREETCRPMVVLVQMEAQQIIKNPATLAQAMERISRKDLASEVRKFKKRKKSMRISHGKIKQEELEDFASAHIDVARRQIEIAMESIRLIPKSVWNNCSQYTDHIIKAATDHCTEALNEISGLSGSLSQVTSDEDNSPLSSITSSSEIPVTMLPEKQKPQPLPKPKRKCIHQAWNASATFHIEFNYYRGRKTITPSSIDINLCVSTRRSPHTTSTDMSHSSGYTASAGTDSK